MKTVVGKLYFLSVGFLLLSDLDAMAPQRPPRPAQKFKFVSFRAPAPTGAALHTSQPAAALQAAQAVSIGVPRAVPGPQVSRVSRPSDERTDQVPAGKRPKVERQSEPGWSSFGVVDPERTLGAHEWNGDDAREKAARFPEAATIVEKKKLGPEEELELAQVRAYQKAARIEITCCGTQLDVLSEGNLPEDEEMALIRAAIKTKRNRARQLLDQKQEREQVLLAPLEDPGMYGAPWHKEVAKFLRNRYVHNIGWFLAGCFLGGVSYWAYKKIVPEKILQLAKARL